MRSTSKIPSRRERVARAFVFLLARAALACSNGPTSLAPTDAGHAMPDATSETDAGAIMTPSEAGGPDGGPSCAQPNSPCSKASDCCTGHCDPITSMCLAWEAGSCEAGHCCLPNGADIPPEGALCCSGRNIDVIMDIPCDPSRAGDGSTGCPPNTSCATATRGGSFCIKSVCTLGFGDDPCAGDADCISGVCAFGKCTYSLPGGPCPPNARFSNCAFTTLVSTDYRPVPDAGVAAWDAGAWVGHNQDPSCPSDGHCPACAVAGAACTLDSDCCVGTCSSGVCTCIGLGKDAAYAALCCTGQVTPTTTGSAAGTCEFDRLCASNSDCAAVTTSGNNPDAPCIGNVCSCLPHGSPCVPNGYGPRCCAGSCTGPSGNFTCAGGARGDPCTSDGDCVTTCTNGQCDALPPLYPCSDGLDCKSGNCQTFTNAASNYCGAIADGKPCTADIDCGGYHSTCNSGICGCVAKGCGICGYDYCGNPCAQQCATGQTCSSADGIHLACCVNTSICKDQECGTDPCAGGSCGSCATSGGTCSNGKCVGGSCRPLGQSCVPVGSTGDCCAGLTCRATSNGEGALCGEISAPTTGGGFSPGPGGGGSGGTGGTAANPNPTAPTSCATDTSCVAATFASASSSCPGYVTLTNSCGEYVSCAYLLSDGTRGCAAAGPGENDCAIYGNVVSYACVGGGDVACANQIGCSF